ncbi:hypothetical protein SAMN05880574_12416 [Chryseobacterium sp. RU37D]|uniref:hypothetical protein n=1 Tax=Chryseobacterium sp. RU37D TaxID=1907397 RepID=UPI0009554FDD|nr:hypothetical protein [Chryseobacterium sp. RU37D]SIQ76441.1 hypothetical protein SAMN05880574_12416 [Chryseobacterium sp. RU37D]
MKKNLIITAMMISSLAFSQVGINTASPAATLDVTAKNTTGNSTSVDGLLVPRVNRQRAQSMTNVPTSTLIYVNNVATGTQAGTAINIDAPGYYYFDETNVWTKLRTPASTSPTNTNIYNSDGTLTGNRTVTQADKTLAFTGTATNAFSVDGNTFSADAANHRIGIGTTTPSDKLNVFGGITTSGSTTNNKNASGTLDYGLYQTRLLSWGPTATDNGIISFWTGLGGAPTSEKMRIHSNGNVGIGTTAPSDKLHVLGGITTNGRTSIDKMASGTLDYGLDQTRLLSWGPTATNSGVISFWTGLGGASTSEKMRIHSNGNVGIGTTTPTNSLHVKAVADPLKLEGLQSGSGANLVVDANGVVKAEAKSVPKLVLVVKRGTDFVGSPGGGNVLTWDAKEYDPENVFTTGSDNYTVTRSGLHQIFVNITSAGSSFNVGDPWFVRIWINGVVVAASDATKAAGASTTVFSINNCNVGDKIQVDFGIKPDTAKANLTKLSIFRFE